MHNGVNKTLRAVINHYNTIVFNPNVDPRLAPNGIGQKLNLTETEINNVISFLRTLSGTNLYIDKKWSNPFI
jgi:cytochrome c peroxidase